MTEVNISKKAYKQLDKVPLYIKLKFDGWKESVETFGILQVRKSPAYHDEPLQGKRKGERSVRLNKQWRIVYVEVDDMIEITVLEVMPHDY